MFCLGKKIQEKTTNWAGICKCLKLLNVMINVGKDRFYTIQEYIIGFLNILCLRFNLWVLT